MYLYRCLAPEESFWPQPLPFTCTHLPASLLLPPIQAHNFCSRPWSLSAGKWTAPREYHCFYGPGASLAAAPPGWAFPPVYGPAPRPLFLAASVPGPSPQTLAAGARAETTEDESWAPWPEGSSLDTELHWGRVQRAQGPRLQLPDFVRRELRRVYGTYPRTDVRVTHRRGEFLLQAAPRVGEPEYRVERRVVRRPASAKSGGSSARKAAERDRPGKRRGLS
ncbi:uncharacterized protein C10orf95 homolog [Nycticebus coucang]|uniref:uncharacterized protein C10orf95 homolog n=1 Tax=Nycticebus coucang TaxID=9470 RepID=UPI00234DFFBD|nr:uncharacterized protein C10orf95 homolog [Nycticebus coucang]